MQNNDYVPIAALNQYNYCQHRFWRMFCAGEFVDNQYTIEGTTLHERIHTLGEGNREDVWQVRAVWLKSEKYKLIGKSDLIEAENGEFFPVEYKRGKKGKWDNDELQVCAQALCLEEMTGKNINTGYIYYAESHRRQFVEISTELRNQTITTISDVLKLWESGIVPLANYSPRCRGCSLFSQCLPLANQRVNKYREEVYG